jgi:hypothetical protein
MTSFITDSRAAGAEEIRSLTASEIDFVAGGSLATIGGSFASTKSLTLATKVGPISVAMGVGFAVGIGSGSSAGVNIGTYAIG